MRNLILLLLTLIIASTIDAQFVCEMKSVSLKITRDFCAPEFMLENCSVGTDYRM